MKLLVALFAVLLVATGCPGPTDEPITDPTEPDSPTTGPTEEPIFDIIDDVIRNDIETPEALVVEDAPTAGDLSTEAGMVAFLDAVWADLEQVWAPVLVNYPGTLSVQKRWILAGESVTMTCPHPQTDGEGNITGYIHIPLDTEHNNAYYCPQDVTVYMPVGTMIRALTTDLLDNPLTIPGDAIIAGVLSHEFGHGVADYMRKVAKEQEWPYGLTYTEKLEDGKLVPRPNELLADCLAGVWFHAAYHKGYLEDGDLDEVINGLEVIGDAPGSIDHGSPQERRTAFERGYNTGRMGHCVDAHAPWRHLETGEVIWIDEQNKTEQPQSDDLLAQLTNGQVTLVYDGGVETGLHSVSVFVNAVNNFYGSVTEPQVWWYESTDTYSGCDYDWTPLSVGYCPSDGAVIIGSELMTAIHSEPTYGELATVLLIGRQASLHVIDTGSVGTVQADTRSLVADCLTGLWLGSYVGQTNSTTVEAAYQAIDKQFDPGTFHAPKTRAEWFLSGYQADSISACV